MILIYKNRTLDLTKPVLVYRRLYNKSQKVMYSIKQRGLVVAHSNNFVLRNCEPKINKSGQKRCRLKGVRNVHAYMFGFLCDNEYDIRILTYKIKYNPYTDDTFMAIALEDDTSIFELKKCKFLYFNPTGVYI